MGGISGASIFDGEIAGHHLTVTVDGPARFAQLLEIIDRAQHTLQLFYYIYEADTHGQRVRDALVAAALRGVQVTVLVDGFGSDGLPSDFFAELEAVGGRQARFHAQFGRRYLLRNHQKMVIADTQVAQIGGANIADDYFTTLQEGEPWHDLALRIEGEVVARLATYFDDLAAWTQADKYGIRALQRILGNHSDRHGSLRWLFGGPFQRPSPMTRMLRTDLDAAHRVDMIQAYFSPNWSFLRRLGNVARRGKVRIIAAAKSDNATTIGAARHCYPRLLGRRAEIYEYDLAKLHMKLMVIDHCVYIGSANYDTRSLYINVELMLRIDDRNFADGMRAFCVDQQAQARPIDTALLKQIAGPFRRLRWFIAYFLVSTVDYTITRRLNIQPAPKRLG